MKNTKATNRRYYLSHRVFILKQVAKYQQEHKEQIAPKKRLNHVKYTYGLDSDPYDQMLIDQSGQCAICEKPATELKKRLQLDHNHRTGQIRGLLCPGCNQLIVPLIEYRYHLIQKTIDYLKKEKTHELQSTSKT